MPNVAASIWTHASRNPDRPAVRSLEKSWSYEELRSHVAEWAGALREAGLERGDRVVLIAPSVPEFAAVYHGAQAAGIVVVTLNVMSTPAEIGYVLGDSGARLVIAWHAATTAAERAGAEADVDMWSLEPHAPVTCETPLSEPVERDASEKGWRDLVATIRNPMSDSWDFLTRTPLSKTPNNYPLEGSLASTSRGGQTYQRCTSPRSRALPVFGSTWTAAPSTWSRFTRLIPTRPSNCDSARNAVGPAP